MDAALLPGPHADGLPAIDVADGVGLGILQRDEGNDHVPPGSLRQVTALRHDVLKQALVDPAEVVSLLKGDAEDILALLLGRDVVRVHGDDVVAPLFLGLQNLHGLGGVVRGDDAVRDLVL